MVASARVKAKANQDDEEAFVGKRSIFDVLKNDEQPPDLDISVTDVVVSEGLGFAAILDGKVEFTPSGDFADNGGTASLIYTINDTLGDPDRAVTGRLNVTVKHPPAKPGTPDVSDSGNGFVVVNWETPADGGADIDKYEVAWTSSGKGQPSQVECSTTTCRIENLVNGAEYRFTVRAHNEVDWSVPSDPSDPRTPDARPEAPPVAPALAWDKTLASGELMVSWDQPSSDGEWKNEGTDILEYEVEVNPPPSGGNPVRVAAPATSTAAVSHKLVGLEDGRDYKVRVRAKNDAVRDNGGWSEWSPLSADPPGAQNSSPASKPGAPPVPQVARVDHPDQSQFQITWQPPPQTEWNASAITGYRLVTIRDGVRSESPLNVPVGLSMTSQVAADFDHVYSFAVIAVNKWGPSDGGAASEPERAYKRPEPIRTVDASATGDPGRIDLSFSDPVDNGKPITDYLVDIVSSDGGSGVGASRRARGSGGGIEVTGLTNGRTYAFRVAACNRTEQAYCGQFDGTDSTSPFGPPTVALNVSRIGPKRFSIQATPTWNGRAGTVTLGGLGSGQRTGSGVLDFDPIDPAWGTAGSISARACVTPDVGAERCANASPVSIDARVPTFNSFDLWQDGSCFYSQDRNIPNDLRTRWGRLFEYRINIDTHGVPPQYFGTYEWRWRYDRGGNTSNFEVLTGNWNNRIGGSGTLSPFGGWAQDTDRFYFRAWVDLQGYGRIETNERVDIIADCPEDGPGR
ncbi:MAG: fibronectin type III domain-containing protein [Actinobacteria bacterium]|nr:fibronectin type III domain-containing protein [Actinomycetota bacterium]